jgi:hypothetical protein
MKSYIILVIKIFAVKVQKTRYFHITGMRDKFQIVQKNINQMCKNSLSHSIICFLQNFKIFTNKKVT